MAISLKHQISLSPNKDKSRYLALVSLANKIMVVSLMVFLLSIWVSYGYGEPLVLKAKIAMHLLTIVSAAIFKLGYAIRCVGAFNLGHKAF